MSLNDREGREQDFWGHHIQDLASCLAEIAAGPDPNTEAMLQAVEPVSGARVLDFACGTGTTTAWLTRRGANVVGVDVSPESLGRAREVMATLSLDATFVGSLEEADGHGPFDAVVGRYALHHINVAEVAPLLAQRLRPGAPGAFVETFATNPLLVLARTRLTGRFGIPRMGTLDEHPLSRKDLDSLRRAFGHLQVTVAQMHFLRMFDRQVLRYRSPRISATLGRFDDVTRRVPHSMSLSYFQVIMVRKSSP